MQKQFVTFFTLGVVSINDKVNRKNCSGSKNNEVLSILAMAEIQGLSTGVVTTSRLTHATPASVYAHSADRNWESAARGNCKDIGKCYFTIAAKPASTIRFISYNISMSE